jgi:phospholipid transport system substrate-binding protein
MLVARVRTGRMGRATVRKTAIIACFCLLIASATAAPSPVDVVKTGTEKVLHVLKEHSANRHERREEIRKTVNEYFDFTEMGKRALGPHWKDLSPQKQQEYVQAFSQFVFNVYIDKVEKYTNEKLGYREKGKQGSAPIVEALITGRQADRIVIDYHLHMVNGSWEVYDVVIEGVGMVSNYRAQFDSILSKGSIEDLLKQLKAKNARSG